MEEEGSVESSSSFSWLLLEKTTSSSIRSSSSVVAVAAVVEEGFWTRGGWDGSPRKRSVGERVGLRWRKRFGSFRSICRFGSEVRS